LQAAVAIITEFNKLTAAKPEEPRCTVGRFDVVPNTSNSVAERVSFSVDLRHPNADVVKQVGDEMMKIGSREIGSCKVKISEKFNRLPCVLDDTVVKAVENAAVRLGETYMMMASGAFHDSLFMNDVCPSGMIFVACEKGISHNPKENAIPEDLATGARVLLASLVSLDASL
jgi:N-carbamoyl-L-amino-acid hydrolase